MTEKENVLNNKALVSIDFAMTSLSNSIKAYGIADSKALNLLLFVIIFICVTSSFYYQIFEIDFFQITISSFLGLCSVFSILCSLLARDVHFGPNLKKFFEKYQQKNDLDFNLQLMVNIDDSIGKNLKTAGLKTRFLKFGLFVFCVWVLFMISSIIIWM